MDLTTATPVEIDTALAALYGQMQQAENEVERAVNALHHVADDRRVYHGRRQQWVLTDLAALGKVREIANTDETYVGRKATEAIERLDAANLKAAAIREQMAAHDAEWIRRGRWTRAFLVVNAGGHVHKDMHCTTCYETTQYAWLPSLSGADEAEIIAQAGSDACTVCYPNAPVRYLARPRSIFTEEEKAAQADRETKAKAKQAREAKRLEKALLPDGSALVIDVDLDRTDFRGNPWPERARFTTLASAKSWLTDSAQYLSFRNGSRHPSYPAQVESVLAEAVAAKEAKTVREVLEEARKRAARRH